MAKIRKGQTVYIMPTGNAARRSTEIIETKVTGLGTKYFFVEHNIYGRDSNRFYIETLQQARSGISNGTVYLSLDDISEDKAQFELSQKIHREMRDTIHMYSLSQLRRIWKILNE